jgi:hypothetical protein
MDVTLSVYVLNLISFLVLCYALEDVNYTLEEVDSLLNATANMMHA